MGDTLKFISSVHALKQLMVSEANKIVNISPKQYTMSNGVEYCCVGLKSVEGRDYLIQACGEEARVLYQEATVMVNKTKIK